MSVGTELYKNAIDSRMADAFIGMRNAFDRVRNVRVFLENNPIIVTPPVEEGGEAEVEDPLTTLYSYTPDDAALIRRVFVDLDDLHEENIELFTETRKFTGLD